MQVDALSKRKEEALLIPWGTPNIREEGGSSLWEGGTAESGFVPSVAMEKVACIKYFCCFVYLSIHTS